MRFESSVTAISWIPSEMISGIVALPFTVGVAHCDRSPPDRLGPDPIADELERLRADDGFRIANHLAGWIETDAGEIVDYGQHGGGVHGSTTVRLGTAKTIGAIGFADLRPTPEIGGGWVRFRQPTGGRSGVPAPRHLNRPPFVRVAPPPAWTTLELTIHVDGRSEASLVGASPFPRHWVYDHAGALVAKSSVVEFDHWYRHTVTSRSPWGGDEMAVLVADAESALERQLGHDVMHGLAAPTVRSVAAGHALVEQGEPGRDVALLLDGMAAVVVDGRELGRVGPGAVIGERASLESQARTATVLALTDCTVAEVDATHLNAAAMRALQAGHRREHDRPEDDRRAVDRER